MSIQGISTSSSNFTLANYNPSGQQIPLNSDSQEKKKKNQETFLGFLVLVRHAKKKIPRLILLKASFWRIFHKIFGGKFSERDFKYHAGHLDVDLSPEGKKQVQTLEENFKVLKQKLENSREEKLSYQIISSPLKRARKTAQAIQKAIGDLLIKIDPRLIERTWGKADGLTVGQTDQKFGRFLSDAYHSWFKEITGKKIPGAESLYELKEKLAKDFMPGLLDTYEKAAESAKKPVLVLVSHAGTIKALIRKFVEQGRLNKVVLEKKVLEKAELLKDKVNRLKIENARPGLLVFAVKRDEEHQSLTLQQIQV